MPPFVERTDHVTSYPTIAIYHHFHLRFHYLFVYDFFLLSRSLLPLVLLFLTFYSFSSLFSLFLFLFLLSSCRSPLPYPPRRATRRPNASAITLLLFASPPHKLFLVFFRLRFLLFFSLFYSYLPFAETLVRYRRRGSKCSLQLQSRAMHSRDASTRRSLIRTHRGMAIKNSYLISFLSSPAAFYALCLPNGFNFARLAFHRGLFAEQVLVFDDSSPRNREREFGFPK